MSWQDRLRQERKDLAEKAGKLMQFFDSPEHDALPPDHQAALLIQSYAMRMYGDALDMRLELLDE